MQRARTTLKSSIENRKPIILVIGNESADLDSITSSILYAYIRSMYPKANQSRTIHIPVINIPKADIALRPELLKLLPYANLRLEHLITLDDLPALSNIDERLLPEQTEWILVDHNVLQGRLGELYSNRVVGTIDHHTDEGKVPKGTGNEPRIIHTSGSCTSLVVNYMRESWDMLLMNVASYGAANSQGNDFVEDAVIATLWDAQAAQLGLASILIDTRNLKDEHKTTNADIEAVEYLEARVNICHRISRVYDRDRLYNTIDEAKADLDPLKLRDIFRKDYKQWSEGSMVLGTSAVVKPIKFMEDKAKSEGSTLFDAIKSFTEEKCLTIFSIMTAYTSEQGEYRREALAYGSTAEGNNAIEKFSESSSSELDLQVLEIGDDKDDALHVWRQGNLSASRKQVAPLLRKAMSQCLS